MADYSYYNPIIEPVIDAFTDPVTGEIEVNPLADILAPSSVYQSPEPLFAEPAPVYVAPESIPTIEEQDPIINLENLADSTSLVADTAPVIDRDSTITLDRLEQQGFTFVRTNEQGGGFFGGLAGGAGDLGSYNIDEALSLVNYLDTIDWTDPSAWAGVIAPDGTIVTAPAELTGQPVETLPPPTAPLATATPPVIEPVPEVSLEQLLGNVNLGGFFDNTSEPTIPFVPTPVQEPVPVAVQAPVPTPVPTPVQEPVPVAVQEPVPVAVQEPVQEPVPVAVQAPVQEPVPVAVQEPEPEAVDDGNIFTDIFNGIDLSSVIDIFGDLGSIFSDSTLEPTTPFVPVSTQPTQSSQEQGTGTPNDGVGVDLGDEGILGSDVIAGGQESTLDDDSTQPDINILLSSLGLTSGLTGLLSGVYAGSQNPTRTTQTVFSKRDPIKIDVMRPTLLSPLFRS